jgi:predicted nucleic acid-binding protein
MLLYQRLAIVVQPATIPPTVPTDPDDDNVLACAVSAGADLIVSGDSDLLTLKAFREIPIVSAAEAVNMLEAGD